jgi:drug/metabolite transporter (DMT)-like permease
MEHHMRLLDWALLVTLSLLWGGSFFFSEIALREVTPFVVVWGRVGLAACMLVLFVRIKGLVVPKDKKNWFAFCVMGLLNNVIPFSLIVWGQTHVTGSLASIFNATTPLFTILLAHLVTQDEKLNMRKGTGVLLGFSGVVVMVGVEAMSGLGGAILAQIAILIAALSYGCAALWGRRFKGIDPIVIAMGQVICSSVFMTPLALLFGFPQGMFLPSSDVILSIVAIAFLCTVLAYILYFRILQTAGASNLSLVTFLIPVSAITLGSVFLGERLELNQLIGMGLILFGLVVIDGRMLRNKRLK